jgi:hypothetical protein
MNQRSPGPGKFPFLKEIRDIGTPEGVLAMIFEEREELEP